LTPQQDQDFTDEFCQFLQKAVPNVDAAELLLRLKRETGQASLVEAHELRLVQGFAEVGFVAFDADGRVRYKPASEAQAAHVATLEKVYLERPVTLFRVIYGLRDAKIRSFADAFKLTRR